MKELILVVTVNKKLFVSCCKIPNTQMLHHIATSQFNRNKSQVPSFCKMQITSVGNLRTDSNNRVHLYSDESKINACKTPMENPTRVSYMCHQ